MPPDTPTPHAGPNAPLHPTPPANPKCPHPPVQASGGRVVLLQVSMTCHPLTLPTPPAGPQCPLTTLHPLLASNAPPQYRHLVVKSGTTAGQHDMSSP